MEYPYFFGHMPLKPSRNFTKLFSQASFIGSLLMRVGSWTTVSTCFSWHPWSNIVGNFLDPCNQQSSCLFITFAGWWFQPIWKMWNPVGMMKFPIYGKIKHAPKHQPVEKGLDLNRILHSAMRQFETAKLLETNGQQSAGVFACVQWTDVPPW